MIRTPEELSKAIKSAVDKRAVLFSHLLLALTITAHSLLDPNTTTVVRVLALTLSLSIVLLVMFRFFDLARINNRPILSLSAYLLLSFIGVAFMTEAATPYVLVFFLVGFLANLYYGSKGILGTVAVFALTTAVKYVYLSSKHPLTVNEQLNIFMAFFVFVAVSSFFVNLQKVYDWDHARLRDTIKEEVLEQKRLRALINNMTESVLVLDKEGIIRLYNAAALSLFNTNNSLSDKPLDGFIKLEDEKGKIITALDLLPPDNKPIMRNDIIMRYSQEDMAALSIVSTPIRSTFGQEEDEEGYVITLRDITREKSLEEERDEFISVISHELRTPVTVAEAGVSNAILLAEKQTGNEKIVASLKTAHDQSVYLANMLNDLSTFARAEKGTLDNNLEELDPRELLDRLVEDYHNDAEVKKMYIRSEFDPSTPLRITSNRLYIREILQNFITNAIKYSDKGTITLKARAKDNGILFSVSDEGIGISVSDQKKIFDKFFRAEDYRTRSTSGTGLGLYITKKLAKILDANFEVSSEVGKGSTFAVFIPDKSDVLAVKNKSEEKPDAATHEPSLANPAPKDPWATKPGHLNPQPAAPQVSPVPVQAPVGAPATSAPSSQTVKEPVSV